jgi:hypothetical protein
MHLLRHININRLPQNKIEPQSGLDFTTIQPLMPYPAFSSSIGSVSACFFTISAVIARSFTFLLPGT